jgi:5S rRNA maturation endonuclease (ribonuclease M5)
MVKISRALKDSINRRWKIEDLIYKLLPDNDYEALHLSGSLRINPCPFTGSMKNALSIYEDEIDRYTLWSSNRLPGFDDLPEHGTAADILCCISKSEREIIDLCIRKKTKAITREVIQKERIEEHVSQDVLDELQEGYQKDLLDNHLWFLTEIRKLSVEAIDHFGLGFDNQSKAYSYPYFLDGKIKHFKYKMKYKGRDFTSALAHNSGGSYFYNEDALAQKKIIFVEGEHDVISIWQKYGFESVGIGGNFKDRCARWSKMKMLTNRTIYLAFDKDEAGENYTQLFLQELDSSNIVIQLGFEGEGKDPDEIIKNGGRLLLHKT